MVKKQRHGLLEFIGIGKYIFEAARVFFQRM